MNLDNFYHIFQKHGFRSARVIDPVTGYKLAEFAGETMEKVLDDLKDLFTRMPGTYKIMAKSSRDAKDMSGYMYTVEVDDPKQDNQTSGTTDINQAIKQAKEEIRQEWKEKEIRDREQQVKNKEKKLEEPAGQLAELVGQALPLILDKIKPLMKQVATQGNGQIAHDETEQDDQGTNLTADQLNEAAAKAIEALSPDYFVHLAERLYNEPELVKKLKSSEENGLI